MAIGSIFGGAKKKILFCLGTCSHWLDSQPSLYNYRGKHWFFSDLSYNRCFMLYIYRESSMCVGNNCTHLDTPESLFLQKAHFTVCYRSVFERQKKKRSLWKYYHCSSSSLLKTLSEVMNFKVKCPSASFTILLFHIGQAETVEGWRKRCSYHEKAKHEWANPPVT